MHKNFVKKGQVGLILSFSLLLAACGQTTPNGAGGEGAGVTVSTLPGKAVPMARAQALVLAHALRTQELHAQAVEETSIRSVLVNDLDGEPFYWLTVRGPQDAADFWAAAAQANTPVTATGASTDRNLMAFEFGSDFADRLLALRARLGNLDLVSPQGQVIYAIHDGKTYDVQTGEEVSAEQLQHDHEVYAELKAGYLKDTAAQQALHEAWEQVGEEVTGLPAGSVDGLGNLVPGQAVKASQTSTQGAKLRAQTSIDADPAGRGFLNRVTSRAGIAGSGLDGYQAMAKDPQQVTSWQALQNADPSNMQQAQFAPYSQTLPEGGKWGMRLFNPLNGQIANWNEPYWGPVGARMGCVPTSVLRAITANLLAGGKKDTFAGDARAAMSAADTAGALQKLQRKASEPVQADSVPAGYYEPRISKMMGAGEFQGGTLVTPLGFGNGIYPVLNMLLGQGKYRVEGVLKAQIPLVGGMESTPTPDFNTYTRWVRDAVRRGINEDGDSVMFMYSSGGGGGHMSISHAYRAYEYIGGYTDVFLFMGHSVGTDGKTYSGKGDPYVGDWINVTNRWSAYGGAVAIRRN